MLVLPPSIPPHLAGRARRAAVPIYQMYDDVPLAEVRKRPGIVGAEPAQRCVVTARFHGTGGLKRLDARAIEGDVDVRPDQFLSEVPIFGSRDRCGRKIGHDLANFLLEREAAARIRSGTRELVALADQDLRELADSRRLEWFRSESFDCAGRASMALFRRLARLEIEMRAEEPSHHARLAAIAAHQDDLARCREKLELEKKAALAWYDDAGQPNMPHWLDGDCGYADHCDRVVLLYRATQGLQW